MGRRWPSYTLFPCPPLFRSGLWLRTGASLRFIELTRSACWDCDFLIVLEILTPLSLSIVGTDQISTVGLRQGVELNHLVETPQSFTLTIPSPHRPGRLNGSVSRQLPFLVNGPAVAFVYSLSLPAALPIWFVVADWGVSTIHRIDQISLLG